MTCDPAFFAHNRVDNPAKVGRDEQAEAAVYHTLMSALSEHFKGLPYETEQAVGDDNVLVIRLKRTDKTNPYKVRIELDL